MPTGKPLPPIENDGCGNRVSLKQSTSTTCFICWAARWDSERAAIFGALAAAHSPLITIQYLCERHQRNYREAIVRFTDTRGSALERGMAAVDPPVVLGPCFGR